MLSSSNQLIAAGVKVEVKLVNVRYTSGHVVVKGLEIFWSTLDMALESMVARQMISLNSNGTITTELTVMDAIWSVICRAAALVSDA